MSIHARLRNRAFRPLLRSLAAASVAALALAGCASTGGAASADPAALEQLSEQRWAHLVAGEFGQAWEFLSPGYRQTKSREAYANEMSIRPVSWTSADYVAHECSSPERCEVKVRVGFSVRSGVPSVGRIAADKVVTETWIFLSGRWVYLPPDAVR